MRLLQIDYFLAVAETLNYTSAAKNLYVSQPALSKQIALLEDELGVKLFYRNSKKVALTEAGIQFEKDLKSIKIQLEEAKARVKQIGRSLSRVFHIACFDGAVTDDFLPQTYAVIRDILPDAEISMFRGSFQENKKALESDKSDLLLVLSENEADYSNYEVQCICRRKAALVFSRFSPLAEKSDLCPKDFCGKPFLVSNPTQNFSLYHREMSDLHRLGIVPSEISEQENMATLITNLSMGKGFAILSEKIVRKETELCTYELDESYGMEISAVWKKSHPLSEELKNGFSHILR